MAVWKMFPRVKTFPSVFRAQGMKTYAALRRRALAEARGAKVWARFSPSATASANYTAGDAHLEIDIEAVPGVRPMFPDGGLK